MRRLSTHTLVMWKFLLPLNIFLSLITVVPSHETCINIYSSLIKKEKKCIDRLKSLYLNHEMLACYLGNVLIINTTKHIWILRIKRIKHGKILFFLHIRKNIDFRWIMKVFICSFILKKLLKVNYVVKIHTSLCVE